jgi:hypothetical protein
VLFIRRLIIDSLPGKKSKFNESINSADRLKRKEHRQEGLIHWTECMKANCKLSFLLFSLILSIACLLSYCPWIINLPDERRSLAPLRLSQENSYDRQTRWAQR